MEPNEVTVLGHHTIRDIMGVSSTINNKTKVVINFGDTEEMFDEGKYTVLNGRGAIRSTLNLAQQLTSFPKLTPEFTFNVDEAQQWLDQGEDLVLVRPQGEKTIVKEIEIGEGNYIQKYHLKKLQYRLHIVNRNIIFRERKDNKKGNLEEIDYRIRSRANGFFYKPVHNPSKSIPETVALGLCGLDFGSVDIIYDKDKKDPRVIKVLPYSKISSECVMAYASAFTNALKLKTTTTRRDVFDIDHMANEQGIQLED
jgi:hypothetical protein